MAKVAAAHQGVLLAVPMSSARVLHLTRPSRQHCRPLWPNCDAAHPHAASLPIPAPHQVQNLSCCSLSDPCRHAQQAATLTLQLAGNLTQTKHRSCSESDANTEHSCLLLGQGRCLHGRLTVLHGRLTVRQGILHLVSPSLLPFACPGGQRAALSCTTDAAAACRGLSLPQLSCALLLHAG